MVDIFLRKKDSELDEFGQQKPWEKRQDWSNPFDSGEESMRRQRQEERRKRKKQSKRSSRRHHMTEEEYTELSSKADSMLDDLLGDDNDNVGRKMPQVREGSFEGEDSTNAARAGSNPFDDPEDEEEEVADNAGEEINKEEYENLMKGVVKSEKKTTNPFADDESTGINGIKATVVADDSSAEIPPEYSRNPFEDDSVADSTGLGDEEDSEGEPPARATKPSGQALSKSPKKVDDLQRKSTDTTHEADESECEDEDDDEDEEQGEDDDEEEGEDVEAGEEDEEDIVESSKRLLRMVDQRIQYQHQSDEVKKLRETIDGMKHQAEAMSEQLRRAVETKCDLVLAQTEMERCHEQNLIAKDDEIHDLRQYIQLLLESQAMNELNFMNEISSLSKRLDDLTDKHKKELCEKDFTISQLESKVKSLQNEALANNSSAMSSFRNRFIEAAESSDIPSIAAI